MKVSYDVSGSFNKTMDWLKTAGDSLPVQTMKQIGAEGAAALYKATPLWDTGETARGWRYFVEQKKDGLELSFVNNAHPELYVNMAKLIEFGHGTRNGGYVPPFPYIKRTIGPILDAGADKIVKEMMR